MVMGRGTRDIRWYAWQHDIAQHGYLAMIDMYSLQRTQSQYTSGSLGPGKAPPLESDQYEITKGVEGVVRIVEANFQNGFEGVFQMLVSQQ